MAKRKSALEAEHLALGAGLGEWNDMDVPWSYSTSTEEEHDAVRERAALFDMTALKRFWVSGPDAMEVMNRATTRDLSKMEVGMALYTIVLTDDGNFCHDPVVYRVEEDKYLYVHGTGDSDQRIVAAAEGKNVTFKDDDQTHTLSLQGPKSVDLLAAHCPDDVKSIPFFGHRYTKVFGIDVLLARTGYSGERGYELYVDGAHAVELWKKILQAGEKEGIMPASFNCLNRNRVESGLVFYPFDVNENHTPWELGFGWAISRKKEDFLGREGAFAKEGKEKIRLTGVFCESSSPVIDNGAELYLDGEKVGVTTSANWSHRMGKSLALAHVRFDIPEGTKLKLGPSADAQEVEVENLPFYDKERKRLRG